MVSVKILGGDKAGGQSNGGGGEMGGKDTMCMRSRGHVCLPLSIEIWDILLNWLT